MATSLPMKILGAVTFYAYGLFSYFFLLFLSIQSGSFFRKPSEKETNDLVIARDRLWNLSKSPLPGFSHHFYRLRNGFQLHYISNKPLQAQPDNLIIFIHGFPDSYAMWMPLLQEPDIPIREATYVCVDLPGFGGSDSFPVHDTAVLEALAEFIIAMRDIYLAEDNSGGASQNTYVVGHDWGGAIAVRLASESPALADRFITINGPSSDLMAANGKQILESSRKIFRQFRQAPWTNFGCLAKSMKTASPLFRQARMSGYIFAFNLPQFMVKYFGTGGNMTFIRTVHSIQYNEKKPSFFKPEGLATALGPSVNECKAPVPSGVNGVASGNYGSTVLERAKSPGNAFWTMTSYYRDGPVSVSKRWIKSLELIAELHALDSAASQSSSPARRRSSSSASSALFTPQVKGMLHCPTTVIWGEKDVALNRQVCLDGISDFLPKDSQVILLPRSGHWTPLEPESRAAIAKVVGLYANGRNGALNGTPIIKQVLEVYEGATMPVKK